jgi:hypothetical protein
LSASSGRYTGETVTEMLLVLHDPKRFILQRFSCQLSIRVADSVGRGGPPMQARSSGDRTTKLLVCEGGLALNDVADCISVSRALAMSMLMATKARVAEREQEWVGCGGGQEEEAVLAVEFDSHRVFMLLSPSSWNRRRPQAGQGPLRSEDATLPWPRVQSTISARAARRPSLARMSGAP